MKLKKLEITGFKSFLDKASIHFPPGISAVVGPNGCGKSNIVDALRWVMGEQSVKQLRGKSMEDVIFAGADGKKPLGMAEVSLTLLNDNGSAPQELREFSEIMITRRLYRSGESAYLLNKQPCRLKDIHNVFIGSGMGAKSYAIIQQGNMGAITDAGPEERRFFIEEAAGITRYKTRKSEALRKVAATQQNLLRLNDIITEVDRQMNGLKRQARKAELFNTYQKRVRELDALLALHNYDLLTERIQGMASQLRSHKETDMAFAAQLATLGAAVETFKLDLTRKEQSLASHQSKKFDIQRKLDKTENDLVHFAKEKDRLSTEMIELNFAQQELEKNNTKIQAEIEQVEQDKVAIAAQMKQGADEIAIEQQSSVGMRTTLEKLKKQNEADKADLMRLVSQEARLNNVYQVAANNKENIERRLKRIDEDVVLATRKVNELTKSEADLGDEFKDCQQQLMEINTSITELREQRDEINIALGKHLNHTQAIEYERNKVASSYQSLKQMDDNHEWYQDGVRSILNHVAHSAGRESGPDAPIDFHQAVIGVLADKITPEPGFETAVEAVLAESLQYIVVEDQPAGMAAVDYLQTNLAGRGGFIPISAVKAVNKPVPTDFAPEAVLLNHIQSASGFEAITKILLGHVLVSKDLQEAVTLWNQNGFTKTVVSRQGDLITPEGTIIGGSKENKVNILAKKQELKALKDQLSDLDDTLAAAKEKQAELTENLKAIEITLQERVRTKEELIQEHLELEKAVYKVGEDLKHAIHRLDVIRLEQEQLQGEACDIDDEMAEHHQSLDQLREDIQTRQDRITHVTAEIDTVEAEMEAFNQKIVELKLKQTSCQSAYENSLSTYKRLGAFLEDGQKRFAQIVADIGSKTEKHALTLENITQSQSVLDDLMAVLKDLSETLESDEAEYNDVLVQLKESEKAISKLKSEREGTLQEWRKVELEQSQLELKRENIAEQLVDRYHHTLEQFRVEFQVALEEFKGEVQSVKTKKEALEKERERLKSKVSNIGDVNLGAIQEYEEHKVRYDFLSQQRDDLLTAIDDLQKVIKKINHITQEKFLVTFDAINQKLNEVFPRLFDGGSAKLVLTEPDNPLETGVEFMIHPPGKKLTRLSLLSGGEKALSAIAFIFSIFFLKPASFCLMDEIDAPLDDANVFRFNNLLKMIGERSQVLMITHNKHTMEFADTLFGVTMEKKGISKLVSVNLERPN